MLLYTKSLPEYKSLPIERSALQLIANSRTAKGITRWIEPKLPIKSKHIHPDSIEDWRYNCIWVSNQKSCCERERSREGFSVFSVNVWLHCVTHQWNLHQGSRERERERDCWGSMEYTMKVQMLNAWLVHSGSLISLLGERLSRSIRIVSAYLFLTATLQ